MEEDDEVEGVVGRLGVCVAGGVGLELVEPSFLRAILSRIAATTALTLITAFVDEDEDDEVEGVVGRLGVCVAGGIGVELVELSFLRAT
ncbi:hypothetical protein PAECIP111893_01300 [Paenibacillus plantiphilus]|uniref:Uncharacterized protein n=1 Tax=Paenibacillus plantiphilus TaxID=2905650 RepID=A0ABM9C1U6_9BACL|nr:hypothetical protein [Paenibacillus plantiphilus]CAH1199297.1 hypothetical protein PAECIP111893_01300 [Paenibacillus plantiphilus]